MRGQAQVHIDASPDIVFQLVSDVTRMGEQCDSFSSRNDHAGPRRLGGKRTVS